MNAGLPNITGFGERVVNKYPSVTSAETSAILVTGGEFIAAVSPNGALFLNANLTFDASRNNKIYSSSNTVTPDSLSVRHFIKY